MVNRSWLYVPGDDRDKLDGALARGADAIIVDLEDSVAPASKDVARTTIVDWLSSMVAAGVDLVGGTTHVWVRINATADWRGPDLEALAGLPLAGIVVPKASRNALIGVRDVLRDGAADRGLAGLVEDARALADLAAIATTPGLTHLGMGEADLRADLHLDPSDDEVELQPLRSAVVVASAAAGIQPPVGATATDFRDLAALRRSTDRLRRLGFSGRTAIHPRQVDVINDVFTPSADEVARAHDLVDRLREAAGRGQGVVTDADGRMVDEAVARQARHTLELAAAARRHESG